MEKYYELKQIEKLKHILNKPLEYNDKILDVYATTLNHQNKGNQNLKLMGSNFGDFKLRQGISVMEKGREKHGSNNLGLHSQNRITLDEYHN